MHIEMTYQQVYKHKSIHVFYLINLLKEFKKKKTQQDGVRYFFLCRKILIFQFLFINFFLFYLMQNSHQDSIEFKTRREYLNALELRKIAIATAEADTDEEFSDSDSSLSSDSDFEFAEPAPVHLCNYCKKPRVFTNEKQYKLHMRAHMRKWRCEICKDEFRTRVSLIHHRIICEKKKLKSEHIDN